MPRLPLTLHPTPRPPCRLPALQIDRTICGRVMPPGLLCSCLVFFVTPCPTSNPGLFLLHLGSLPPIPNPRACHTFREADEQADMTTAFSLPSAMAATFQNLNVLTIRGGELICSVSCLVTARLWLAQVSGCKWKHSGELFPQLLHEDKA